MSAHLKSNIEKAEWWLEKATIEATEGGDSTLVLAYATIAQTYVALPSVVTLEERRVSECPYSNNHAMFAGQGRKCPLCGAID